MYPARPSGESTFLSATALGDAEAEPVVGDDSGAAWRRTGPRAWAPYDSTVPQAASECRSSRPVCGRHSFIRVLTVTHALPNGGGVLFGREGCSGVFWRGPNDPCASALAVGEDEVHKQENDGPRAVATHDGRVYVAVGRRYLYELLLEDGP